MIKAAAILPAAVRKSLRTLNVFAPHAVTGVGGYVSGPSCIAAVLKNIPLFLLEQNVYPGLVTRMLAKRAKRVYTSFEGSGNRLKGADVFCAGNPTRPGFGFASRQFTGKEEKTLLVMGGSQGAHSINMAMLDALPLLKDLPLKIIHQTGQRDYGDVKAAYEKSRPDAVVEPFIENMPEIMRKADLAVARAGASTCAELALTGLPAILVPYPFAGGHQKLNAKALAEGGAAEVVYEEQLSGTLLAEKIKEVITDSGRIAVMSANSREMARPDAARIIAKDITKIMEAAWA